MKFYVRFFDLLNAVVDHVQAAGVGRCTVTCDDDPRALQVGFMVTSIGEDPLSYRIRLADLRSALPHWRSVGTLEGRQALAEVLSRGEMPMSEIL